MTEEAKKAKREATVAMMDRLSANGDFRAFVFKALDEFCAWEQGYAEVDQFRQGVRAAGSWIMKEMSRSEAGREALAAGFKGHLSKYHNTSEDTEE